MPLSPAHLATWTIALLGATGVIVRPWKVPEAVWAVLAAVTLAASPLMTWADAGAAVLKGVDVYLFLMGMMLLAALARHEGLFDWLASHAVRHARGSGRRLFALIYLVGTVVTIFLSNDATAVVLTPAVYAAAKQAKAEPLPYLFICAFIANAASFVLPISNPANLVVYGTRMPSLEHWLGEFGMASIASIGVTYVVLRYTQRSVLTAAITSHIEVPTLPRGGRLCGAGIALTAVVLLLASSLDLQLGLPTFMAGLATASLILLWNRTSPWIIVREISWGVLPLVAGLFVLVEAVEGTGVLNDVGSMFGASADSSPRATALLSGGLVAMICNLINNLPLGLLAGSLTTNAQLPSHVTGALVIGVDLGPNLSVTGSLATVLWLVALRRERQVISAWQFMALGLLVMPPALLLALGTFIVMEIR